MKPNDNVPHISEVFLLGLLGALVFTAIVIAVLLWTLL